ncbi:MAG: RNA polymerase sigma factor [Armatimonadetes bacterium]|nr:RNA polymerase sigma factor [Armatimonadota bacterium]
MSVASLSISGEETLNENDLDDLLLQSRSGDLQAFNRLVEFYYDKTFYLAYRILGRREVAEDATQEIFFKAWRHLSRFRGAARFSTWLHSIAVHHCLDEARRQSREAARVDSNLDERWEENRMQFSSLSQVDRGMRDWDRRLTLHDAIAKLPEKLRLVVTLRYYGEYSADEVAGILDLPPNTVRSRLYLAMHRLRRDLGDVEEWR